MKWICLTLCIALMTAVFAPGVTAEDAVIPELDIHARELPDNEALRFTRSLGVGWNLGNTFDATAWKGYNGSELNIETIWCGAKTPEGLFDALKEAGVRTVRIPVSWHDHVDADLNITPAWLERVAEVAGWAYDRGLHVIVNIHHDFSELNSAGTWLYPTSARYADSERYMRTIWQQVAARFADWDDRLIFESMNEPRMVGTSHEWRFEAGNAECEDSMDCINRLNQVFVDTVRASGGHNADRYLMVPSYAASADAALSASFRLPEDAAGNRVIVSVHAYTPYDFALNTSGGASFKMGNSSQAQDIVRFMNGLYDRYITQGLPVVIGEFGALRKVSGRTENLQDRVDFTAFYAATAAARGLPCLWWDNHSFSGNGENFGLIDRKTLAWKYPVIMEALTRYGLKGDE